MDVSDLILDLLSLLRTLDFVTLLEKIFAS
jgi:hypothetical protein